MAESPLKPDSPTAPQYVVVARRYRPQLFDELMGQEHVARALSNAIGTGRVGHAYLFTGARGVGKTSTARILAKALNCTTGPSASPCNACDICQSISSGEDVDVLEIDGASNRGIDEIRQLRQNVNVRPSRARFKIYIIDEVHMLTREAFNALLKTLEEPPEHVKFIFCTTEASKIPVTILSRCQRFDFAGISSRAIAERLEQIIRSEGVSAEAEALELLARRASGSMRDSQSLLEQLLAFAPERITVADVHSMLGSARDERLKSITDYVAQGKSAGALAELDAAIREGVDVALLLEQLLGYLRDAMVAAVGAPAETYLTVSPANHQEISELGRRWGLESILAAMQILDQTLSRLRYSTQGRMLAELALVRIASLEQLDDLSQLIAQLQDGAGTRAGGAARPEPSRSISGPEASQVAAKKKAEPSGVVPPEEIDEGVPAATGTMEVLTSANAGQTWSQAIAGLKGFTAICAKQFDRVASPAPNRLVVSFRPRYTLAKSYCTQHTSHFEQALREQTGQTIRVEFELMEEAPGGVPAPEPAKVVSPQQRLMEVANHPMVRRAKELFGAQPVRVDDPPERP